MKIIAIDAFGGDHAPKSVFGGMNQFLFVNGEQSVRFRIFGDEKLLTPFLNEYPRVARNSEVIHCPDVIKGTDKVADVIRHSQNTSMYRAVKDVREGNSVAVVSAGNTGVLMALAKLALKTIDGISRPAITTMLPAGDGDGRVVMLDLGANIHCDSEMLFDFAILGCVYAECVGGIGKPRLGLLNIGSEEQKGLESLQVLNRVLTEHKKKLPYEYLGFVEGDDIGTGDVNVVVTDGFTGNIVLKTVEGTARMAKRILKSALTKSIMAMIGAFFLINVFKRMKNKIDPRSYAGAVFMGVNGFVVKTHGSSDALTFSNAIDYTLKMIQNDVIGKIKYHAEKLDKIKKELSA